MSKSDQVIKLNIKLANFKCLKLIISNKLFFKKKNLAKTKYKTYNTKFLFIIQSFKIFKYNLKNC